MGVGRIGQVAPDALRRRRRAILPTQRLRHQRSVAILSGKLIPEAPASGSGRGALSHPHHEYFIDYVTGLCYKIRILAHDGRLRRRS
jgi:hypothetical protein